LARSHSSRSRRRSVPGAGFINEFVARDPWFAGWCGVMVNISDVAAMGGRPIAVVDAVWGAGDAGAAPILDGLKAAAQAYSVPVVGGHTNTRTDRGQLAVGILGRARRLLTSFDARPTDRLIAAIDLRGRYREPFSNWEAATTAPAPRLVADLEVLPLLAEEGLSIAAKDISQAGLVGTAMMLAECSRVGLRIDIARVPKPAEAPLERWLQTFPSYGFLVAAPPPNAPGVLARFRDRGIAVADIGEFTVDHRVVVSNGRDARTIWDFAHESLIGCTAPVVLA
jgi:uncharacterized protein